MLNSAATAIATDSTTLAAALFLKIFLVKTPFVPGGNLVVGDLTPADFAGSAALANTSAVMLKYLDPATGEWIIEVPPPVGGWHWQTTSGVTNLPQTIYGFGCMDSTGAILYGSQLLPAPLLLNGNAQGIDVPAVRFRLNAAALS
jgi:hypothetical protein